jgi:hypothetical protein
MTDSWEATIELLDQQIAAISDPVEQHAAIKEAGLRVNANLHARLRALAKRLKIDGRTWPQVGELLGGVSGQRAHQISKGE